jgi:hypothetical protein
MARLVCVQERLRGGVQPPSEAESRSRGRPILERGKTSPEGAAGPRSRQGCTGASPYPSSEAEFRPRVARPIVWWAVGPRVCLVRVFRLVCVCFFANVSGFSLVV